MTLADVREEKAEPDALAERPADSAGGPFQRFLYYLYERRLLAQVRERPMPRHIGIILDGNRRHGRMRGLSDPREVYRIGARKLDDALTWCADLGIATVTLWVFSTANLPPLAGRDLGHLVGDRDQGRGPRARSADPPPAGPRSGDRPT